MPSAPPAAAAAWKPPIMSVSYMSVTSQLHVSYTKNEESRCLEAAVDVSQSHVRYMSGEC